MKKVAYSKSRILAQSGSKSFISKKIAPGTVLTIVDIALQEFEDNNGNKVKNDMLIVTDGDNASIKLPVKEFMKMKVLKGERYEGDSDNDEISLPSTIKIINSEDRKGLGEDEPRYPTYAYKGAQEFIDSKGALDYKETVINSGLREDNPFDPIQNYEVELN